MKYTMRAFLLIGLLGIQSSFVFCNCFAQNSSEDVVVSIDASGQTTALPGVFSANIDLSGRGSYTDRTLPQTIACTQAVDAWKNELGFSGLYRMQYNLWEISQLEKDPVAQEKLKQNYEKIIKTISDSGGTVIVTLFGTPAGMGKVLDKKSTPWDLRAYKALVKSTIRELSCTKRYNIWYEVWNAPDLDDFYLGRRQEYFSLYRVIAESIEELKNETKVYIPLGGPSVSWWFQSMDGNTTLTPERSLIYELIKYCYHYRLPLDFISWHAYSTDPRVEKEITRYKKSSVQLVREWLSYFQFNNNVSLIIDEWNFDRNANQLVERKEKAYISASYIPARLWNMYEAGIDRQVFFSLEDFYNEAEGVVRNVGVFYFDPGSAEYKGGSKSSFLVFKMIAALGTQMYPVKNKDEFVGIIPTKTKEGYRILIYNYIDPDILNAYLNKTIASLPSSSRKQLLGMIKSGRLDKILNNDIPLKTLRLKKQLQVVIKKAQELKTKANLQNNSARPVTVELKNVNGNFMYSRFIMDSSCNLNCSFVPSEQKETGALKDFKETLNIKPYSVILLELKNKPKEEINLVVPEQSSSNQSAKSPSEQPRQETPADSERKVPAVAQ